MSAREKIAANSLPQFRRLPNSPARINSQERVVDASALHRSEDARRLQDKRVSHELLEPLEGRADETPRHHAERKHM